MQIEQTFTEKLCDHDAWWFYAAGESCFDKKGTPATSKMLNWDSESEYDSTAFSSGFTLKSLAPGLSSSGSRRGCWPSLNVQIVRKPHSHILPFENPERWPLPHAEIKAFIRMVLGLLLGNILLSSEGGPILAHHGHLLLNRWDEMRGIMDNKRTLPEKASAKVNLRQTSTTQNRKELIMMFSIYLSIHPTILNYINTRIYI